MRQGNIAAGKSTQSKIVLFHGAANHFKSHVSTKLEILTKVN